MNAREARLLSNEDLLDAIEDAREAMFNLRFQKEAGQMEDTNSLRYAKRDLARLLTVQRERELAEEIAEEEVEDDGE